MDYFLEVFGGLTLSTVIMFCAAIGFVVVMGMKGYKILVKWHDEMQERELMMAEVVTKKELEETLKKILEKQEEIIKRQLDFEEQNKMQNQNKLRDMLLRSYRYYANYEVNPMRAWSEMEKEAFDKLFKDYEELGGNGFMHSMVEPAMEKLKIIEMTDAEGLAEMARSRKN